MYKLATSGTHVLTAYLKNSVTSSVEPFRVIDWRMAACFVGAIMEVSGAADASFQGASSTWLVEARGHGFASRTLHAPPHLHRMASNARPGQVLGPPLPSTSTTLPRPMQPHVSPPNLDLPVLQGASQVLQDYFAKDSQVIPDIGELLGRFNDTCNDRYSILLASWCTVLGLLLCFPRRLSCSISKKAVNRHS